jgi:hypothetical protein
MLKMMRMHWIALVIAACAIGTLRAQQDTSKANGWNFIGGYGINFDDSLHAQQTREGQLFYLSGTFKPFDGFVTFGQWSKEYYGRNSPRPVPDSFRAEFKPRGDMSIYNRLRVNISQQGSKGAFFPAYKYIQLDTAAWTTLTFTTMRQDVPDFFLVSFAIAPRVKEYAGQHIGFTLLVRNLRMVYADSTVLLDAMMDTATAIVPDTTGTDTTSHVDTTTSIMQCAGIMPASCGILQNYPNPFNPATSIPFTLNGEGYVDLSVYDILGRRVATLASSRFSAGTHTVSFDGSDLPSGIYVAVLAKDGIRVGSLKIMLQK